MRPPAVAVPALLAAAFLAAACTSDPEPEAEASAPDSTAAGVLGAPRSAGEWERVQLVVGRSL